MNELLSKAPGDLTEKEVAELEELTSRLAKENGDLKSAAEKAAEKGVPNLSSGEQKKLDDILSKDPSKLSVDEIKDLEDMTSKLANENAALRKPLDSADNARLNELLSKAPGDLTEKEVAELEELTSRLAKENGDLKSAAERLLRRVFLTYHQGNRRSWTTFYLRIHLSLVLTRSRIWRI